MADRTDEFVALAVRLDAMRRERDRLNGLIRAAEERLAGAISGAVPPTRRKNGSFVEILYAALCEGAATVPVLQARISEPEAKRVHNALRTLRAQGRVKQTAGRVWSVERTEEK